MKLTDLQSKYKNILFICEKPSLAEAVATALPGRMETSANKLFFTCEGGIKIAKLAGHVMRLAEPEDYNKIYEKWAADTLPIIVTSWRNIVTPKKALMFKSVKELIAKSDCIINAGDPDREGQLLVDEVIEYCKYTGPVYRFLGGNNIEVSALQKSFNDIKSNKDFEATKKSAQARQRADWTIGMNLTRLFSLYMQQLGFKGVTKSGRVKAVATALVVDRINTINTFTSVQHYKLKTSYIKDNIKFTANWLMPKNITGLDEEGRLIDINVVNAIVNKIKADNEAIVTDFKTELKSEKHPLCFSQSTLTSHAGKKYGYAPDEVLAICQELYEEKILTYPRSEKEHLPESQFTDAKAAIEIICNIPHFAQIKAKLNPSLKSRVWVQDSDKKVSPHHAIIPTLKKFNYDSLTEPQRQIYDLVATRYIAQFLPEHEYKQTTIDLTIGDQSFRAIGKITTRAGWRELFGKDASEEENPDKDDQSQTLPQVQEGDDLPLNSVDVLIKKTTPPKPYTKTTLYDAMVDIHLYVKDKKIQEILKGIEGIATTATRANIIKELCQSTNGKDRDGKQFEIPALIEVRGKKGELYPSPKALKLYEIMPDNLKIPDTTAMWEKSFNDIESTDGDIIPFTVEINKMVTSIVNQIKPLIIPKPAAPKLEIPYNAITCPKCKKGKMLVKKGKYGNFYGCSRFPECKHVDKVPEETPVI